jgi:hypothetical protein
MVSCQSRNAALALRADLMFFVMPGLVPGIHVFLTLAGSKTWMAGTSPAMTNWF